jgi:hypothetical protein
VHGARSIEGVWRARVHALGQWSEHPMAMEGNRIQQSGIEGRDNAGSKGRHGMGGAKAAGGEDAERRVGGIETRYQRG